MYSNCGLDIVSFAVVALWYCVSAAADDTDTATRTSPSSATIDRRRFTTPPSQIPTASASKTRTSMTRTRHTRHSPKAEPPKSSTIEQPKTGGGQKLGKVLNPTSTSRDGKGAVASAFDESGAGFEPATSGLCVRGLSSQPAGIADSRYARYFVKVNRARCVVPSRNVATRSWQVPAHVLVVAARNVYRSAEE